MKAVMVMYDSLNRRFLEPYGGDAETPNFRRLAERAVCFETNFSNSLPCMPARREIHTGRYNFLHRSWGPIEPFDESMPQILSDNGVYTHLVSDHWHYWRDGGATYHNRYSSYENTRGQEGDKWKGIVDFTADTSTVFGNEENPHVPVREPLRNNQVNRIYIQTKADMPMVHTFDGGTEFIDVNHAADNWFLQIECFDPHEPFYLSPDMTDGVSHIDKDWPPYYPVRESEEIVGEVRERYKQLLKLCDEQLGRVLDKFDEYDLWKDTMLIVNTDHGFMLGEHNWWGKSIMPLYNELVNTPLFVYDPRFAKGGERRKRLTGNIDLAPTLLEFFGMDIPESMQGRPLRRVIECDEQIHDALLFGIHGGYINVTDGKYVYMLPPATENNTPLYEYTLMPTHHAWRFKPEELTDIEVCHDEALAGKVMVMKIPKVPEKAGYNRYRYGTKLFDIVNDYGQKNSLKDADAECRMLKLMLKQLRESGCPKEQYIRMGLPVDESDITPETVKKWAEERPAPCAPEGLEHCVWEDGAAAMYEIMTAMIPEAADGIYACLKEHCSKCDTVSAPDVERAIAMAVKPEEREMAVYYARLSGMTE